MVRAALLLLALAVPVAANPPQRVVSMNLCTDQLAMLVGPDQVIALSRLASDPLASVMAEQARAYPTHDGLAEQIFLLNPDLVLAGTYSERATVDMLRHLGVRVETLPPALSVEDVRQGLAWAGKVLDQPDRAAALVADFDVALAAVPHGPARLGTTYAANGWATGAQTLPGDVLRVAGITLLTDALGQSGGAALPLEQLVMANPDLIVTGTRYDPPSRAESLLDHPALTGIGADHRVVADRDWICGLPSIAQVAQDLAR